MELCPIGRQGELSQPVTQDDHLHMVLEFTAQHYQKSGYVPPWIAYLAVENAEPLGTCAFKTAPSGGRVEIAYGTMSGLEGKGIATAMARELIEIARREDEGLVVFAQTLPLECASTSILKKLGFKRIGSVQHPEDGMVWEWEHEFQRDRSDL